MAEYLMIIGAASIIGIIIFGTMMLWEFVTDMISKLKYRYRYKHRFDKPPTAKCYCIDCIWHNNETERCYRFHANDGRLTADHCFCYEAEPRKKEM